MGEHSSKSSKRKKKPADDTSSSSLTPSSYSSSSSSSSDDESSLKRHKSSSNRKHREERSSSRREREKRREREREKKRKKRKEKRRERDRKRSSSKRDGKRKVSDSDEEESESDPISLSDDEDKLKEDPVDVVRYILEEFPAVSNDLEQLLQMIDEGQAVDIGGLSERSLVKHLRRLFLSLNLKENGKLVFLLPSDVPPTLDVVGAIIRPKMVPEEQLKDSASKVDNHPVFPDENGKQVTDDTNLPCSQADAAGPKRRVIGPAMPSAELLAAAAKLTEAEAELRDAEMDEDSVLFIGPPPPAVVKEAESANEAERFEEITRIMGAEVDNPYDVVGVNRHMAADNIKKRYWKLSLMVHPDKCTHPQAHQAFIKLNKSFKELQDPEKRKAMDEKIDLKEEQERFKVELKAMREAAQWRRLQGISLEGDDMLLADLDAKEERRRDEWMTTLPPERKPGGMPTHSTSFSRTAKEGRGDTSAWTETPSERAQKAKMNYLDAYNQAAALASNDDEGKKARDADAELVDKYNKAKRSKSLVEKHQEKSRSRTKKKSTSNSKQEQGKDTWEGQHPWKPWDRDKDLTAGRQNVKLDADNMSQGLTSRFSSGSFQRNFL